MSDLTWLRCCVVLLNVLLLSHLTSDQAELKLLKYFSSSNMPLTATEIAKKAAEEAKNILGAAPGLAADAASAYVKNGTPSGVIPNVGVAIARQACRRYADNPNGPPSSVAAGLERVCRPYLDNIGYGVGPTLEQPLLGGQCPVLYNVTFNATGASGACNPINFGTTTVSAGVGPISIRRFHNTAQSAQSGGLCPGYTANNILIKNASGEQVLVGQGRGIKLNSISVARADGQPDNCGDRPPDVTGPVPPATPGPTKEPFNPIPGIDIDIDVTLGPTGPITINIGTGPITIDPFGDGDSDGGDGDNPGIDQPGTAPSSGLPPGDIGQPSAPVDTTPGGVASSCAPPNSVLVGIKINIMEPVPSVNQYDPLVYRGVCYAYMGTVGNLALNPEGVALRNGQMLFAPLDNLTCWEVRANMGFILRVTPYYRALEPLEV